MSFSFFISRAWVALAALASLLCGCQPEIGDSCTNPSDCSVQEQRTCDTTLPDGYCTVLGCAAGTCPSEAVCVGFQTLVSVAPECADLQSRPRLQRSLCMLSCDSRSDCRAGYDCVDMAARNPWGAVLLERGGSGKVCSLPPPPEAEGETGVCEAREPLPLPPALDAGLGADAGG